MRFRHFVVIQDVETRRYLVVKQVRSLEDGCRALFALEDRPPYNEQWRYRAAVVSTSHPEQIPLEMLSG
ncbi:MAG: hypothetical protein NVS3B24_21340 [Candidatus Dormibacteria bacterium]